MWAGLGWGAGEMGKRRRERKRRVYIIYDKPPNGWAPQRSPYREVYFHVACTNRQFATPARIVYTQRDDAPCQSVLTPTWRVIVRIEMDGGWYWLYRRRASLGMPLKRVRCGRFRGAAHHGTARRRRTTPQDQLNTPVPWARWTVRQQLTLRRHQARPKPYPSRACGIPVRCQ